MKTLRVTCLRGAFSIMEGKMNIIEKLKRNPCVKCDYYNKNNNTCQSKKCATCGCHPYVNKFDKMFCEPYKQKHMEV